ncbi:MAG: Type 1 glutamine amidotransferase-like domain-containing protein, partial [Acidimicrobiia bacterium]
ILDEVGVFAPEVVILPLASFRHQAFAAGALAHEQWTRLGAHATVVLPGSGFDSEALDAVARADVIVLPGGVPNRLMVGLSSTAVFSELVSRWRAGAAITGSSAGAMDLFEKRLNLYPPNPFRLIPGLGLLEGYVAAPHFDRLRVRHWYPPFIGLLEGLAVIGIDESTGLVGRDGEMQVLGEGSVTVLTEVGMDVYPTGSTMALELTVADPGPQSEPEISWPSRSSPAERVGV